jgi:hypothetical protein
MKICYTCKREKPFEEFNWKNKNRGTRCSNCRECSKLYQRNHYRNNTAYYVEKARRRNKACNEKYHKRIFKYLSKHPCVDCGEPDPIVLEFDHIDPRTKKETVAVMLNHQRSWKRIMAEIAKCEVRCANCHRRKSAREQRWYSHLLK